MSDINSYANDLLIEFLDAAHKELRRVLHEEFGDAWFEEGIARHLNSSALDRTQAMLTSPMAIIDMERAEEEVYGVEHLGSVVIGNWGLFGEAFGNRNRTEVYFGEISELRHNVSHRRQRHMLRRGDLLRFVRNAHLLLKAFDSPTAATFDSISVNLEQGGSPWGNELGGALPPAIEIVSEFVGRDAEMRELSTWLTRDDDRHLVIWGYGGSGKSALAYQFARAVRDSAPSSLQAVVWLSAKVREYVEGETRDRLADFDSVESFGSAFWAALYGAEPSGLQETRDDIIRELSETPMLLIVDDLDSVLDSQDLAHFLLYETRMTKSKVIYTSRHRIPGLQTVEVRGFSDSELSSFVRVRAREYELNLENCLNRIGAIRSVTDGFPLFVDDLLRHAILDGLTKAIEDWSQRRGDAAREYALRRQLSSLGEAARRVLIALSVASRPVSGHELATISGFTDDDVQHAIRDLVGWRLLNLADENPMGYPTFSCNRNTQRLVQKTYTRDPIYGAYQESFRNLVGSARPPALRRAVGSAISDAKAYVIRGDSHGAEECLRSAMTGELETNSDLWGTLGWVISRRKDAESTSKARLAFTKSHTYGSRKEDTYYHWMELEREIAERLIDESDEQRLLELWRGATRVAELGIERCGDTPALCGAIAYLKSREAKTLEHLSQFTAAQTCFQQSADWARKALAAPNRSSRDSSRTRLYRSLVIALDGCGDSGRAMEALQEWEAAVGGDDPEWRREYDRLASLPAYRGYL